MRGPAEVAITLRAAGWFGDRPGVREGDGLVNMSGGLGLVEDSRCYCDVGWGDSMDSGVMVL